MREPFFAKATKGRRAVAINSAMTVASIAFKVAGMFGV